MKDKDIIITGYSNVTKEGVVLHLNKNAKLKTGVMSSTQFWVSWDKIGEALFENYADYRIIDDLRKEVKP